MILPGSLHLPINKLAACFNNTSATYKFYWLLGIMDAVEKGETTVRKNDIFARMVAMAWYPVNYFHLSFGKQDMIQRAIVELSRIEGITIDEDQAVIFSKLSSTNNKEALDHLKYFDKQVPHWFLTPWFGKPDRKMIYEGSRAEKSMSLYALYDTTIVINPKWFGYLKDNAALLKAFCYWNLAIFLQARNPNTPDIPNKLIKPASRGSLIRQRKEYWDIVVDKGPGLRCIYTDNEIIKGNYHIEHFIPYSWVSHDLMWNLIPADKSFNVSKGNRLPVLDRYFEPFFNMQVAGIDTIRREKPDSKFLDDFLTVFPELPELEDLHSDTLKTKFREVIIPSVTIASNNGFEFMS